jgi:hypothetical protein
VTAWRRSPTTMRLYACHRSSSSSGSNCASQPRVKPQPPLGIPTAGGLSPGLETRRTPQATGAIEHRERRGEVEGPWRCRDHCGRGCGGRASSPRPPERGLEGDFASAPAGEWRGASCEGGGRGRRRGTGVNMRPPIGTGRTRSGSSLAFATVGCGPLCGLGSP